MLPQRIECFCAPFEDAGVRQRLEFWREIEGVDFTPAFELFSRKIMVETISPQALLSAPTSLGPVDLRSNEHDRFAARVYIPITRPGTIHGIASWFCAQLTDQVSISTAPDQPATHWKQAILPLRKTVDVVANDMLDWGVAISPKADRGDDTIISYEYRCTQLGKGRPAQ